MNESLATAIVGRHYPQRTVAGVDPTTPGHRPTTVVRFAAHPPVVVQLSETIDAVRTEAALVGAIRDRTDVPVPPVLATGIRDAAFPFGGCGEVGPATSPGDALTAPSTDCSQWLAEYGRRSVARLPDEFDDLRPKLLNYVEDAAVDAVTPRLFPWDLRPGNALAADGTVSAVLDWERPMAAPPALALAKAEYLTADWYVDDPAPLRTAFRAGYEGVRSLPTVAPVHRVVAIADSAVDSRGAVTNPGYPERDRQASVEFHRGALASALSG